MEENAQDRVDMIPMFVPEGTDPDAIADAGVYWEGPPEAQAKLVSAIAAAMLNFGQIKRDTKGQIGNRYFEYAPLVNLTDATRVALAKEGVIVLQPLSHSKEAGKHRLTTMVCGHGARMVSYLDFEPAKLPNAGGDRDSPQVANLKEYGKQTTYLRRYTYQSTFVLDAEPDADEAGAPAVERPAPRREPPKPEPRREPPPAARAPAAPPSRLENDLQRSLDQAYPRKPASEPPPPETEDPGPASRPATPAPKADGAKFAHLDDNAVKAELRAQFVKLGMGRIAGSELSMKIVGLPLDRLDRPAVETLLSHLQTLAPQRAS